MEHVVEKALDTILSQGGMLGALLIAAAGIIGFLIRAQAKMSAAYEKKLDEVHAARITELRDVMAAQSEAAASTKALSLSIDARTTVFAELSGNVSLMAQAMKAFQDAVKDQLDRMERDIDRERR